MKPTVFVYKCVDPDCPPKKRHVAHWFNGTNLQVATATADTAEVARELLIGPMSVEVRQLSVAKGERTPEQIAAAKERTAKARQARWPTKA